VNWSSVFSMFSMTLTRPSLTMQLMSGVNVFTHVCGQKADTSSNYCDNIQPYDKICFSFCQMWHDFQIVFLEITTHSNFWLSQGGKYYIDFVRNLLLFTAVKKFWKFFKNWQSYRHEFGVYYFFGTQCMSWLLFLTQATIFMLTLRPLCTIPVGDPRRELVQVVS